MKRWVIVLSVLAGLIGIAVPAAALPQDAEPPCADIVDASASEYDPADGVVRVVLSLAAPSCPHVTYGLLLFERDGDPTPASAPVRTNVQGEMEVIIEGRVPPSTDDPHFVATTSTSLLRVTLLSSLLPLPTLTLGTRVLDRAPDSGMAPVRVHCDPLCPHLSFD